MDAKYTEITKKYKSSISRAHAAWDLKMHALEIAEQEDRRSAVSFMIAPALLLFAVAFVAIVKLVPAFF